MFHLFLHSRVKAVGGGEEAGSSEKEACAAGKWSDSGEDEKKAGAEGNIKGRDGNGSKLFAGLFSTHAAS